MKSSLLRAVALSAIVSLSAAPAFALDTGVSGSASGSAGVSGSTSDTSVGAGAGVDAGVNAGANTGSGGVSGSTGITGSGDATVSGSSGDSSTSGSAGVSGSASANALIDAINEDDVDPADPFGDIDVNLSGDFSADNFSDAELAELRARCDVIAGNSDNFDASASAFCEANADSMM